MTGLPTPYDEGLLCEDCAEADTVRFWVGAPRDEWSFVYRCPPDCPRYPPGMFRLSLRDAAGAYAAAPKPWRKAKPPKKPAG